MKKLAVVILMLTILAAMTVPVFAEDAAKVFDAKCAICHGKDGAGKVKGTPDLRTPEVQKVSDQQLFDAIAKGPNGKETHAFAKKGLDDATIKGLVAYIRTLKK